MKANEFKQVALPLVSQAYLAQPVKQPDGSFLDLCLMGRITRAYRLLAEAKATGATERATALQAAIDKLNQVAETAMAAANKAVSDYCAACIVEGKEPEDLYPPACRCVGCQETGKLHCVGAAVGAMRAAVWALLGDDGDGEPPLLPLVRKAADEQARGALWTHLVKIANSMQEYANVCRDLGAAPNWKQELWG